MGTDTLIFSFLSRDALTLTPSPTGGEGKVERTISYGERL
jgi:hypothetical protein